MSGNAANKNHWEKYGNCRQRRCYDGSGYFTRTISSGLQDSLALLAFSNDIFQYDYGIVDKHANRECDATKRHDVERDIVCVHQQERAYHRYRYCDRDNRCGSCISQKTVQNHYRQQATNECGGCYLLDCGRNKFRLIVNFDELQVFRERFPNLLQPVLDPISDLHRVSVTFLVDGELD